MSRQATLIAVLLLASLSCGCRSTQLARDQDAIRSCVLDLHTNQIMDNLVRAKNGLPILQLDYTHMTGTITQIESANAGTTQVISNDRRTPFQDNITSFAAITRVLTNTYTGGLGASQTNQLTITAEPVTNSPDVYNAYLKYIAEPGQLVVSEEPPPEGAALLVRCCKPGPCDLCSHGGCKGKVYYWIPCTYREEFLGLALSVMVLRGEPSKSIPYFAVTITEMVDVKLLNPQNEKYSVRVKFDKKIPNDTQGTVAALIRGRKPISPTTREPAFKLFPLPDSKIAEGDKMREVRPDEKADTFILEFSLKEIRLPAGPPHAGLVVEPVEEKLGIADVLKELSNQQVRVYLKSFIPGGSKTDNLLEELRFQLDQSRLNQLQLLNR